MKRILYALGIIAIIALIVWLGFTLRYTSQPNTPANTTSTTQNSNVVFPSDQTAPIGSTASTTPNEISIGDILGGEEKVFGKLFDKKISSYTVTPSSTVVFVERDGRIGMASGTVLESLSSSPIPTMIRSSVSYNGDKVLVILGTETEQASVFDVKTRVWELLPKDARGAVWAPRSQEVAYVSYKDQGRVDIISLNLQPTKHTSRTLATLNAYDLKLDWINPDTMLISERSSARIPTSAWLYNIRTQTFTTIAADERGSESIWEPAVTNGLVFTANNPKGGKITFRSNKGIVTSNFNFLTLPSKCIFEPSPTSSMRFTTPSKTLICGIPMNADTLRNAELPDDYNKWKIYTPDVLYRIDLNNANIDLLRSNENEYIDVSQLSVTSSTLFFVNRYDDGLYFLKTPRN